MMILFFFALAVPLDEFLDFMVHDEGLAPLPFVPV